MSDEVPSSGVLIMVRDAETRQLGSPWLSHLLANTLFWGEQETLAVADTLVPCEDLDHETMFFAGALVDVDNRRLLWFMQPDVNSKPR